MSEGKSTRSLERVQQHGCQLSPARGWGEKHLQPRVTGADGGRPEAAERPGRWEPLARGRPPGQSGRFAASPPRWAPLQPSPLRPPTLPLIRARKAASPARLRPTRRPGLPGVGTRGWSASRPPRRGGAGNADTTSREGRGGEGGIASQELRSFPVAGPPLLRHPSHVTGSAGSAHAEGRGLCLGAGPVRDDWHPRKPKEESAASTEYQK